MKYLPIKRRLLLGIALLALLSWLLWQSPPRQLQDVLEGNTPKVKAFPLFYMRDMATLQYAVDGGIAYQLETVKFDYYEGQGLTAGDRQANGYATLEKPLITFHGEEDSPWQLSAANGESRKNGELVILMGDVRLWRVRDGVVTNELTTQSLTLKPREAFAQTDKPVVAKSTSGTVQATGAKLFIDSSILEFSSEVRGTYDEP